MVLRFTIRNVYLLVISIWYVLYLILIKKLKANTISLETSYLTVSSRFFSSILTVLHYRVILYI